MSSGGKCALTKCCCFDLHAGTRLCMIYTIGSTIITGALVLLDLIDMKTDGWGIAGSFNTEWRFHINDVMTALDVVMIFAHLFMFCLAILTFAVSRNEDTKLNVCMLLFFTVMMCLYILIEFAVNCYFFTWMNHNIFILPYLAFLWGFWILRTCLNIMVAMVTHSRIIDLKFQKKYDLLNMPGVNHSLSTASMLSGSMRSVAGQQHIRAMSSQRLYASRQSLGHAQSRQSLGHAQSSRSLHQSQQSLNMGRGAANF